MSQPSATLTPEDFADLRELIRVHGSRAKASRALGLNANGVGRILKHGVADPSTLQRIRAQAGRQASRTRIRVLEHDLAKAHAQLEEAVADRLALEAEVDRLAASVKEARDTAEANQDALRVLGLQHTELLDRHDQAKDRAARVIACQAEALHLLTRAVGA